jgi:uncharacterized protein YkwD
MGTAIPGSHISGRKFSNEPDRLGGALTVLSSARLRCVKALCSFFLLILFWAAAPAAGSRRPGEPDIRIPTLEHRVHDLINKQRVEQNLTALSFVDRLSTIARGHSRDMGARRFFSHTNPDGLDPTARGRLAGFTCRKQISSGTFREGLGENLYQDNLYNRVRVIGTERSYDWNTSEDIAVRSVRGWMNSPGHRHNILDKGYSQTGIGIAITGDDKVFITQLFC